MMWTFFCIHGRNLRKRSATESRALDLIFRFFYFSFIRSIEAFIYTLGKQSAAQVYIRKYDARLCAEQCSFYNGGAPHTIFQK